MLNLRCFILIFLLSIGLPLSSSIFRVFEIEIVGIDLSEDRSIVSTHNDEIYLLIYSYNSDSTLKFYRDEYFVIDSITNTKHLSQLILEPSNVELILSFLEMDNENRKMSLDSFSKGLTLKKGLDDMIYWNQLLGDNDYLGSITHSVRNQRDTTYELAGQLLFDKYRYLVQFGVAKTDSK